VLETEILTHKHRDAYLALHPHPIPPPVSCDSCSKPFCSQSCHEAARLLYHSTECKLLKDERFFDAYSTGSAFSSGELDLPLRTLCLLSQHPQLCDALRTYHYLPADAARAEMSPGVCSLLSDT
jgi:hypothetical protein